SPYMNEVSTLVALIGQVSLIELLLPTCTVQPPAHRFRKIVCVLTTGSGRSTSCHIIAVRGRSTSTLGSVASSIESPLPGMIVIGSAAATAGPIRSDATSEIRFIATFVRGDRCRSPRGSSVFPYDGRDLPNVPGSGAFPARNHERAEHQAEQH